ncbi:MAG TPA: AmmeMemoRadiSam system protein A [Geopsychrobacteraceae bacterium]|nr:AmmeMemoRadiSam system protein A [Geopsychrobacteraceae bacterium]
MMAPLSASETATLLRIARQSIIAQVTSGYHGCAPQTGEALNECCGCFVTITRNGQLRGCIGNFSTDRPLYLEVAEMAASAATKDPRFHPMEKNELDKFSVEISVLSPLQKVTGIEEIHVGTHGIYLEKDFQRGVLLPQVATEHRWDTDTFLQQTCRKAGLPGNAWQAIETDIYIFSATILKESD